MDSCGGAKGTRVGSSPSSLSPQPPTVAPVGLHLMVSRAANVTLCTMRASELAAICGLWLMLLLNFFLHCQTRLPLPMDVVPGRRLFSFLPHYSMLQC